MSGDDSKIQDNFFIWLRKTRILSLLDEHDITDLEDMIFGQPTMINPLQNSINNYQISASLPNSGNNNGNTGNNFQLSNSFPLCINTNNINGHYNAMNLNGHYNAMNLNGHYNAM
eukprot:504009_1